MTKKIKINDSFIVNALRNCGYNNYSAIADIIDNSLEADVASSTVRVSFETVGKGNDLTTKSISIIDDGNGMSSETLEESMTLGSQTGKNAYYNLGLYGAGMKTASFSIGQQLEVYTKTESDDVLNYAIISLKDAIDNGGEIFIDYQSFDKNSDEYINFTTQTNANHGTIVKISELDKLSNKDYYTFTNTLKSKLGEIFNKFILADVVKIYVGKDKVPYVDLISDVISMPELLGGGSFTIDGCDIAYKAYYIPHNGDDEDGTKHHKTKDGCEFLSRNALNAGLYIYRQNRLVGKALNLGIFGGKYGTEQWFAGFRCEICVNGQCDSLFGTSFTKMIGESTNINQALKDKLSSEIKPFANECRRRDKKIAEEAKTNNLEYQKELDEFYNRVTEKQNQNQMLRINRKGENKPKSEPVKEHTPRGKQKNPNPFKHRVDTWIDGFKELPMGRTNEMYTFERANCKKYVIINTDHPFYQKFYCQLDNNLKFIMAQYISCQEIAKQGVNYYNAEDVRIVIDTYNDFYSSEVAKSLTF